MNNYIGKTCPFCKTEFKESDEIVVCSNCDMPHHKDCWIENQGCTTFGCMGAIKSVDNSSNTVTATEISYEDTTTSNSHIFCTKCGAQNASDSAFCSKCGNSLRPTSSAPAYEQANPANTNPNAYTQSNPANTNPYAYTQSNPANTNPYAYTQQGYNYQPNNTTTYQQNNYNNQNNTYWQTNAYSQNGTIDPDIIALVGTNQQYYIPKFQQMKMQNKKTSWNWAAFFCTAYWFMYRKMYGYGFAVLGIAFLVNLINNTFFSLLLLGVDITIGIFANYIYMQWVEKNANQIKTINEPFKMQFIQKNSGVNSTAVILTIVGWVVLMGLMFAI